MDDEVLPDIDAGEILTSINKDINEILNDESLKETTFQYCMSILGFIPLQQTLFDKPPWLI